jgi:hypothetical protein
VLCRDEMALIEKPWMKWIGLLSNVAYLPADPRFDFLYQMLVFFDPFARRYTHTDRIDLVRSGQEIVDGLKSVQNAFGVIHALD